MSGPHVRGPSAYNRPASVWIEALAVVADFGTASLLFFILLRTAVRALGAPAVSSGLGWLLGFLASLLVVMLLPRRLVRRSLGEMCWDIQVIPSGKVQRERLSASVWARGIFLTASTWSLAVAIAQPVLSHPLWLSASVMKIEPFLPKLVEMNSDAETSTPSPGAETWAIQPFFYVLGAWPQTFRGVPVAYQVPYEKGPPGRFFGHFNVRWELSSGITLTFEGPKTPMERKAEPIAREQLRNCINAPMGSGPRSLLNPWRCLHTREHALGRHLEEMLKLDPEQWSVRWFEVDNGALPPTERAQGVFLKAETVARAEIRYILISPNGAHQAIILSLDKSEDGLYAEGLLKNAIGGLRMSDELGPGQAWTDGQLSSIRLEDIPKEQNPERVFSRLSRIQGLLISKLSVDPATLHTYFHLAGTAMWQLRAGKQFGRPEEIASGKALIQTLYRYAEDVATEAANPERKLKVDPTFLPRIQNLWLESKKY